MKHVSSILAYLLAGLLTVDAAAQHQHGVVEFETSCSEDVAEEFNTGVALLHHMMYEQAAARFDAVASADPECAMAYWGKAMAQLHPLWAPPTADEDRLGREAVESAVRLGGGTDREQAYIAAVQAFFETEGDFGTRLRAWSPLQQDVFEAYPDDVDAAAFAGLAQLAVSPSDDKTFAAQDAAGRLLRSVHDRAPEHPGLFHYTIHAYDNPVLADQAVDVARGYDRLAPEVPHALHMPSHIFVRIGLWPDVQDWNRRSADAALKHPVGDMTSMHYAHAMDYLVYAYLQQGLDEKAKEALDELMSVESIQPHVGSAYALAAAPARYALERHDWSAAASLEPRRPESFPWDQFPALEAVSWFARGLGSARSGDLSAAREALETLKTLQARLPETGERYWMTQMRVQPMAVEAWIYFAEGRTDEALDLMRAAADAEDAVDKHPVTPSPVVPARELLGEMLLLTDRHEEALEAFETSLAVSRNRLNSLTGAAFAAHRAGDREAAERYTALVEEVVGEASGVRRPRLAELTALD